MKAGLIFTEENDIVPKMVARVSFLLDYGIVAQPASLGDRTGWGGEIGINPPFFRSLIAAAKTREVKYTELVDHYEVGPASLHRGTFKSKNAPVAYIEICGLRPLTRVEAAFRRPRPGGRFAEKLEILRRQNARSVRRRQEVVRLAPGATRNRVTRPRDWVLDCLGSRHDSA